MCESFPHLISLDPSDNTGGWVYYFHSAVEEVIVFRVLTTSIRPHVGKGLSEHLHPQNLMTGLLLITAVRGTQLLLHVRNAISTCPWVHKIFSVEVPDNKYFPLCELYRLYLSY